jgi:hypothetical protein
MSGETTRSYYFAVSLKCIGENADGERYVVDSGEVHTGICDSIVEATYQVEGLLWGGGLGV